MTDIVIRLRNPKIISQNTGYLMYGDIGPDLSEAATEIERLRSIIKDLEDENQGLKLDE